MKKITNILVTLSVLSGFAWSTSSCVEEPELMETLELGACLTPTTAVANIDVNDPLSVTFTWSNSKGATDYVLEIYEGTSADDLPENVFEGDPMYEIPVEAAEEGTTTSYTERLEESKFYFARVKAQKLDADGNSVITDSHWATFNYPIEPYLDMDPVQSFEVTERTENSISVSWTIAEDDIDGITQIRLTPDPENSQTYKAFNVTDDQTSLKIEGLSASSKYVVAAHYNSANRGEKIVWTMPSLTEPTEVADNETFHQAVKDGARTILLTNAEENYTLYDDAGEAILLGVAEGKTDFSIYGQGTPDGTKPTITGKFTLPNGLTSLHLEGVSLSGDKYEYDYPMAFAKDFTNTTVTEISLLNCDISGYKSGLIQENTDGENGKSITVNKIDFSNIYVADIQGSGGDGIDIRKLANIGEFSITESTFTKGFRTFVRLDANTTVTSFKFNNNTVNNLCYVQDSGNKGLFNIRATISTFEINNNLFLNMDGNEELTVFFGSNTTQFPTAINGNWYYSLGPGFWKKDDATDPDGKGKLDRETGLTGGGILDAEPCVDSEHDILNLTNVDLVTNKIGDPRWFTDYVPAPTPELEVVEYGYVWDLTDTYTFYDVVDASTVRGNTEFIIESTPVNVTDQGMEFSGEATLAYGNIPTDGAIAFLVNGPGSVFVSALASESGSVNNHITVAIGSADGNSATVMGSVYVGAEKQKVVFEDIPEGEQRLVYLYACGPVVMSYLEWSADTNSGNTAVDDPVVTVETSTPGALSLKWDAVENASGYVISFGAKAEDAEYAENEYILETTSTSYSWEAFPNGEWTVNVQAIANDPAKFSNSAIKAVPVKVEEPAQTTMSSASLTQDDFALISAVIGKDTKLAAGQVIMYKNFMFTAAKANKVKFGNDSNLGAFYNSGGSSTVDADAATASQTIRFLPSGNGKLELVASASGSAVDTKAGYAIAGSKVSESETVVAAKPSALTGATTITYDEVAVTSGQAVDIYTTANAYIFSLTWTPTGGAIPYDATAINEEYTPDFTDATKFTAGVKFTENQEIELITYGSNAKKQLQFSNKETEGVKFGGASDVDDNGIPENRYVMFKTTKPGKIGYKAVTSTQGDTENRHITIKLVKYKEDSSIQEIITLVDAETVQDKTDPVMKYVYILDSQLADTKCTAEVYIYPDLGSSNLPSFSFTPGEQPAE